MRAIASAFFGSPVKAGSPSIRVVGTPTMPYLSTRACPSGLSTSISSYSKSYFDLRSFQSLRAAGQAVHQVA